MLPESLLKYSKLHGEVVPHYIDERDHPWLRLLLQEYERFVGRPRNELLKHLKKPMPFLSPHGKRALAIHLLSRLFRSKMEEEIHPVVLREALFNAAASATETESRESIISTVAASFMIEPSKLEASLFADLPSERLVTAPEMELSPSEIALRANCLLVQGFLCRATAVQTHLEGNSRLIVRHAKLRGLICQVRREGTGDGAILTVSGPFVLFRRSLLYGRALGELVPLLAWCNRFRLRAKCLVREEPLDLIVGSGDPIFPAKPPREFDSRIEANFAKSFQKRTIDWDLIREPEPIDVMGSLIFPDFMLKNKNDPDRIWWLEIIGFWTPDYLKRKLERLKLAAISNLILCICNKLNCSDGDLPSGSRLVRFRGKIDPMDVIKIIEAPRTSSSNVTLHSL